MPAAVLAGDRRPGMAEPDAEQTALPVVRRAVGRLTAVLLLLAITSMLPGATAPAAAHETTGASTVVELGDRSVVVTSSVGFAELGYLDTSGDGLLDADELVQQEAAVAATIVSTVRDRVTLSVDGEQVPVVGAGVPSPSEDAAAAGGGSPYVVLVVALGPHDGEVADVELDWAFVGPSSTVVLSHPGGAVSADLGDDGTVAFSLGAWASAVSFFVIGVEHIRDGPDHLLFLLVLTVTVVGRALDAASARRTVVLVTAFTVGHALSLCLAYLALISVPASIVEPAISSSVVVAAVLALRRSASPVRLWLALVVGIVHGLGFASSLGGLGVASSQQAVALASFNVGIDVAQTLFVLLVLGALWVCGRLLGERARWVHVAVAASAAGVGLYWTAVPAGRRPCVSRPGGQSRHPRRRSRHRRQPRTSSAGTTR